VDDDIHKEINENDEENVDYAALKSDIWFSFGNEISLFKET
jgi:hypothetical protein